MKKNEQQNNESSNNETSKKKRASNKRYDIEIIEEDGTKKIFRTLTEANKHYGVRKDYLNYCFSDKYKHYLKKNGLNIKSIKRLKDESENKKDRIYYH